MTSDPLLIFTDSILDDVKKLKVRIELNGLRLNKPRPPGELSQWLPSGDKSTELEGKLSPERSEVNGSWSEPRFLRRDAATGEACLVVPVYVETVIAMVTEAGSPV